MAKDLRIGSEGRAKLKAGIDTLANTVKVTLGPKGRNVIFCLLYTSPSPRDLSTSRMPSSA